MAPNNKRRQKRQALSGADLRRFRSDVAKLKAKGLVSKHKDARTQKPTRYMRAQVAKYKDVLDGKAKVLHIKRKEAKSFADKFRVKGGSVVIPAKSNETIRYSKKDKAFHGSFRTQEGKRIRKTYASGKMEDVIKLPRAQNRFYSITFGNGQVWTFDTVDDLSNFMYPYEHPDPSKMPRRKPWANWEQYVEILDVEE